MKLLVDMNLSPRWVKALAQAGIEAVHWSSLGAATAPDTVIMAFARANGYVVLGAAALDGVDYAFQPHSSATSTLKFDLEVARRAIALRAQRA
jgi:predicted nuclease of predicted toxin-antitoxin system